MRAPGDNVAPVIIRKKKKVTGGDGHHGGAWKVAYADFVTAMMAFFLLMWLLNATTEKQRKGIADYFSPTVPVNRISGGGDGMFGGDSVFSEDQLPQNGTGATNLRPTERQQARGETGVSPEGAGQGRMSADRERFEEMEEVLMGRGGESTVSHETRRHIVTRVTDEGLVVELFDRPGATLFRPGTSEPTPLLRDLSDLLATAATMVENGLALEGHTRARPVTLLSSPVWRLSARRADRMRSLLESAGMDPTRIRRVTGHADREPATRDPMAIRNDRLEVIFLRSDM
ncbi:MAG: flagellar motor protein MotB [Roseovarius sp.]|jgi:chemotaxis protein MotB|nr:flagellar motor protein MotB [Roseovarius sp.]